MKTSLALCSKITFQVPVEEVKWDSLTNLNIFVDQIRIFVIMCGRLMFPVTKKQN